MPKKVMVFGTFDILHLGHIDLFKQAKQLGDILYVVVSTDARVKKIKGTEPMHTQEERKQILEVLKPIDHVILGEEIDVYKALREVRPDVIALGYDQNLFVEKLNTVLEAEGMDTTTIVRLEPYKQNRHKSGKIRSYVEQQL